MKKLILILFALTLIPTLITAQEVSLKDFYPFAEQFDSSRVALVQCPEPKGFNRYPSNQMTPFQFWLTNFPLKPKGTPITDWQGNKIREAGDDAILDIPVKSPDFNDEDLLIYMALNFMYFDSAVYKFEIHLSETDVINYDLWLRNDYSGTDQTGIIVKQRDEPKIDTYGQFNLYLNYVLTNITPETIMLNTKVISHDRVRPGHMFIQFSDQEMTKVSHVSLVLDVCNRVERVPWMLLAYGGDPAQSIIIPNGYAEDANKKWLSVEGVKDQLKQYGKGFFYRFSN